MDVNRNRPREEVEEKVFEFAKRFMFGWRNKRGNWIFGIEKKKGEMGKGGGQVSEIYKPGEKKVLSCCADSTTQNSSSTLKYRKGVKLESFSSICPFELAPQRV